MPQPTGEQKNQCNAKSCVAQFFPHFGGRVSIQVVIPRSYGGKLSYSDTSSSIPIYRNSYAQHKTADSTVNRVSTERSSRRSMSWPVMMTTRRLTATSQALSRDDSPFQPSLCVSDLQPQLLGFKIIHGSANYSLDLLLQHLASQVSTIVRHLHQSWQ